ncbi:hypothetical protein F5B19DRAFT_470096 [Rostrohypoxylon terebratum]|nr:hypothetical protein F5B19DRAFT_470096 [Rostrohypoxylon terebratum]
MTEKDMRLRLVVRRDEFPEVRLIWNVSLESDPTISKLLEKVNETIPLEIEQKGLENYVVELHDDDGTSFECLHFQTVRSVLKPDDRVFIRALDRDDNKQRRISGRYRISSDGRHLIDGIPFGRRRLKVSGGRPSVAPPPRKRARLAYNQEDLDQDEDEDEDEDDDDFLGDKEDTPMLLLTNGEQDGDMADSSIVRINADFDDADADADAEDGGLDSEVEMDDTHNRPEPDDSERDQSESPSDEDMEDEELDDEDLEDELQDLMKDNADYAEEEDLEERDGQGEEPEAESSDLETSDAVHANKISALRAAFPSAPAALCEKLLSSCNGELKTAYNGLVDIYEPKLSKSATFKWRPSREQASSNTSTSRGGAPLDATSSQSTKPNHSAINDDEDDWESTEEEEEEEEEQVPDFVRQFDHRGLPPGSITSGKGLAQMAAVSSSHKNNKTNGESETTSATLNESKATPEKTIDEDDTSSDDASSDSEDGDSESESDDHSEDDEGSSDENSSESGDSHDSEDDSDDNSVDLEDRDSPVSDEDVSSASNSGSDNPSENDSENDSDEDSEDSEDSEDNDSGPEESSTKLPLSTDQGSSAEDDSSQDTSSNESSSESETSSSDDNSEAESSSESESEQAKKDSPPSHKEIGKTKITKELPKSAQQSQLPPPKTNQTAPAQAGSVPVPPGAGKEATRKRNARRRAARKAKKQAQQAQQAASTADSPSISKESKPPTPALDEKALFEAKRQELLNAIANGGVEVDPPSQSTNPPKNSNFAKRKRQEQDGLDQQVTQEATADRTPASVDNQSSVSAQKKRRIDVAAGRRMLFGALGLRNPQSKEDEEKLRANLMKDVRPLKNPRLKEDQINAQQTGEGESTEADPDAWKNKIIYRAVECCQEEVVLSEPPFPFVQRWDPQQQGYWSQKKNKRGGQSKRAQRNEAHFYQDSRSSKKRKHDESAMWDEEGYDDTFNSIDDTTNADLELNYDDPEDDQNGGTNGPTNDASQFTDMDDLPSLPSDLSTLPDLRPGEVKTGMVITWQQWSCSSATGWQPQLSNVTGVVVRIDDDATGVEVCLAKRDRYLDRNEKKYDHDGRRIYDRFEAPDLDDEEEEEEDEGFRTMGFAEMQQPKILQQPLPAMTPGEDLSKHVDRLPVGNPVPPKSPTAAEDTQLDAPKQPDSAELAKNSAPATENPETSQQEQQQQASDGSELGQSGTSSPSRQLHESTSQAIGEISRDRSTQDPSSVADTGLNVTSDKSNSNMLGSGIPSVRQSSAPLFDSHESEVLIGTPKRIKSKAVIPHSSASSGRSGRQPDYSMDTNETQPDSLRITDDGVSAAANSEGPRGPESDEDVSTPTPKPNHQGEPINLKKEGAAKNGPPSSPENPSTPSSLSSINTVWNTARSALSARNTQTPFSQSQSQSQSQPIASQASEKARARKDQEYEEAMRKLDDFSDDLDSVSRIPDSFKRSSQVSGPNSKLRSKSPQIKISPPPTRKRRSTRPPVQFTLPPGTQVVDISSDSEPAYTENYADDEVDGTYSPEPDSFPRGNGWVNKRVETMGRKPRNMSAPVGSQVGSQPTKKERILSSSQSYQPSLPMSSISNPSRLKSRKTSSRF